MPFPSTEDPDYCAGSLTEAANFSADLLWFTCPECGRPIATRRADGRLYPHVSNSKRARRRDSVQRTLIAYGMNRRHPTGREQVT